MTEDLRRVPLLEYAVARLKLPWYVAAGIVTIILLLLLILAAYLDGPLMKRLDWAHMRGPLLPSAVIIYVLVRSASLTNLACRITLCTSKLLIEGESNGRAEI